MFRYFENNVQSILKAQFIVCNSFQDFGHAIFTSFPNIIPVGPLPLRKATKATGHFWSDDPTCIDWLDQQPANSVVYVAFGSIATLDQNQLEEFAFALDSDQMRFLWVTRPDQTMGEHHDFLKQFRESINRSGKGKIVNWCNQEKVLAHPSIVCFVSHCGWNSVMDGVRNGVPFLCLPFFADQLAIRNHLCDVVKVGLSLVKNENGVVTREEIRSKLIELLQSEEIKARARRMKELAHRSISPRGPAGFIVFFNHCSPPVILWVLSSALSDQPPLPWSPPSSPVN
ncbi:hypothetical protein LUZ61_006497 [Rhynchospora tenuis]|uniref:UDP-glycosyltransferases domain-containing protein n=1 Tax=Rhynchospora tenuis TaxID=198213 RepID=A0AAD6EVK1_9POAL|nr:hypothetical protein LUZ61_006497 [Rhynchospora tenuis]